jgi:hypothetical protein
MSFTLQTLGLIQQYRQSKANAETNASAANANAKAAENEARSTQLQSEENARRQVTENRRALASMRAKYGMSGAALDSGSPLAQMAWQARNARMTGLQLAVGITNAAVNSASSAVSLGSGAKSLMG